MIREGQPAPIRLENYKPPDFLVDEVQLRFEIHHDHTIVKNRMLIRKNPEAAAAAELCLYGRELELISVAANGAPMSSADYALDEEALRIPCRDDALVLEIENRIFPHKNTSLEGLYKSNEMLCTQCEAEGFRKITYYPDRPDVMAKFVTTIVADPDQYPVLLSNGNLVEETQLDDGRSMVVWEDPHPKPSYLFALVAGDLKFIQDEFETKSGRLVTLRIFVEAHNLDKCEHAMASLQKAMRWDEVVYGLEYDLDLYMIVAVDDFNMGAMENKGLNVFNSKYVLAKPELATDMDYVNIENIVAHEYFHNWTGNRVTCRDWFQLTLKEGLTVFRDQQFSGDTTSRPVKRIDDVEILRAKQFPEDAGPMAHPIQPQSYLEINNFYTVTVYNKGAEIIRMMHTLAGVKGFRRGMDLYFASHDGQAVTVFDFLRAIEQGSGTYLKKFRSWYQQAGTPVLHVDAEYEEDAQCFSMTFRQSCPATPGQETKQPFPIPIKIGLLDANGDDLPLRFEGERDFRGNTVTILLDAESKTIHFSDMPSKPVASVLREFSAPVKLDYPRDDGELAFLMAHDNDEFNRWDAGQSLGMRVILRAIEGNDTALIQDESFSAGFGAILDDSELDPALAARALMLPSEDYLSQQITPTPVDEIHTMCEHLEQYLAESHEDALLRVYEEQQSFIGSRDPKYMGHRSLKNMCLSYLMGLHTEEMLDLCFEQFQQADNMTDQAAALRLLAASNSAKGRKALMMFYDQWHSEPLAMDKWFSYQALVVDPDTIKTMHSLKKHHLFELTNPNRVRSLISVFSERNPVCFHNTDGSGYGFVADTVLELNGINPQLAARLVAPLTLWQPHNKIRQKLMLSELERIAKHPQLVRNVFELVDKSLQQRV